MVRRALRARLLGFTLLEVMVAVAILGLGLTAILSAQASAVSATSHARHMSVAVGLVRCKMTEIEEQLALEGLPEVDDEDSGPCCEGDETPNMSCRWSIDRPEFPEPDLGALDLDAELDTDTDQLGALSTLARSGQGQDVFTPDAGVEDVVSTLAGGGEGDMAAAAVGGVDAIAAMVMTMVYPDLKAMFEAATRRVTVTLTWTEGAREYDIEVVQWVVNPRQGGIMGRMPGDAIDAAELAADAAAPSGSPPTRIGGPR